MSGRQKTSGRCPCASVFCNPVKNLAVEIDLGELVRAGAGGEGVDFQQVQQQGETRVGDPPPLATGEAVRVAHLPGEGEHVVGDEPEDILPERFDHAQAPQDLRRDVRPRPVVAEGPDPAAYFAGGDGLADVVQQCRPGQTRIGVDRDLGNGQQGVGQGVALGMVVGGLRYPVKGVNLGQDQVQTRIVTEASDTLPGIGKKETLFDVIEIGHGAVVFRRADDPGLEKFSILGYCRPINEESGGTFVVTNFILIGLFVLLGMLFRRLEAFPEQTAQVLNMFALYVSLPAVILLKVPALTLSSRTMVAAVVPWGMLLLSAALVLVLAKHYQWSRSATGVLLLVVPLGNTSFMGVPMVNAFFGEAGIPHLILYDQIGTMLIFATYGAVVLSLYGREGRSSFRELLLRALLFPPTIALLVGLALRHWPYPPVLVGVLEDLAGALTALVMTAIGFQMKLRLRPTTLGPLGAGLGIKLLVAPLAALATCRLLGLATLPADIAVFEAGMPPMVTASALAVAAGMEVELAVAMAGLGIICSFATLPLLYGLIRLF